MAADPARVTELKKLTLSELITTAAALGGPEEAGNLHNATKDRVAERVAELEDLHSLKTEDVLEALKEASKKPKTPKGETSKEKKAPKKGASKKPKTPKGETSKEKKAWSLWDRLNSPIDDWRKESK